MTASASPMLFYLLNYGVFCMSIPLDGTARPKRGVMDIVLKDSEIHSHKIPKIFP